VFNVRKIQIHIFLSKFTVYYVYVILKFSYSITEYLSGQIFIRKTNIIWPFFDQKSLLSRLSPSMPTLLHFSRNFTATVSWICLPRQSLKSCFFVRGFEPSKLAGFVGKPYRNCSRRISADGNKNSKLNLYITSDRVAVPFVGQLILGSLGDKKRKKNSSSNHF
jgi:hypothetical protein